MRLFFLAVSLSVLVASPAAMSAKPTAAAHVLVYHHVAAIAPASTSVTREQFAVHMAHLEEQNFKVVPLREILERLAKGRAPEHRSVAITFDDAYASVFENVLPMLKHRRWPFTVFASTAAIDGGGSLHMSWEQLREIEKSGGTVANHSHTHDHLLARSPQENTDLWRERVRSDIAYAQERLAAELHHPEKILAYPYGEFDIELAALVQEMGYLAVSQQSGPIGLGTSPYTAPRFPVAQAFADLKSLSEKLRTLPLPVLQPDFPATVLTGASTQPELNLRIAAAPLRFAELNCFVSNQGAPKLERLAESNSVRVVPQQPFPVGRSKTTCTAPHESEFGVYYWYSHLWMRPRADGSWYEG